MSFTDWEGFQRLAQALVNRRDEAMLRSAINRSYYAAFQMSVCFAEMHYNFIKQRKGVDHERILGALRCSGDRTIEGAGRKLGRLRGNRWKADYNETINIGQRLTQISVRWADEIIQSLKDWTPNP